MQWVCEICGYLHDDDDPPEGCPVCGAPRSKFSEFYQDEDDDAGTNRKDGDDVDDFDRDLFADYEDQ